MKINGIGNGVKGSAGRYVYDPKLRKLVRCLAPQIDHHGLTVIPDTPEFVTENISGKPKLIHGRRQKKELMKIHGVVEHCPGMKDKRDEFKKETEREVNKLKEEGIWREDAAPNSWINSDSAHEYIENMMGKRR